MSPEAALAELRGLGDPEKAAQMAGYHKVPRVYLGVPNPVLDVHARAWRQGMEIGPRLDLARGLWASDVHEGRVAAAKLLTQARIRPDDTEVWQTICSWVPDFDAWAIADHACMAGHRRVVVNTDRVDEIETWTRSERMWTRRAALVITLPFGKARDPKPEELAIRERVLGWAAGYVSDRDWFIQKAVAWWLRDLSRRDPDRVRSWLADHGDGLKTFARREAARLLPPDPA
ncbi:MAG: DNA alkylation repair protein [Shimia sp.]